MAGDTIVPVNTILRFFAVIPFMLSLLVPTADAATPTKVTFTRVHRPEQYTVDLLKYVATEVKVSPGLMVRFAPMANAMLRRWEDAATEYSTFTLKNGKPVSVSTYYNITDYSSNKLFGLFSKLLTLMGVGKQLAADDIDIAFVLLGGVLNAYGSAAGLDNKAIKRLDGFRLKNSDFLTNTRFGDGVVTITNLKTKKVDVLDLPDEDVKKIVKYAHQMMTVTLKENYTRMNDKEPPPADLVHYKKLFEAARKNPVKNTAKPPAKNH